MPLWSRIPPRVAESHHAFGLLDTSVVIDLERVDPACHATDDADERARRQERLQRVEATFDPLPFDGAAARAYGVVYAAVAAAGRKTRGRRALDLLIAATALAGSLPLYTRNPADFAEVTDLVDIVPVPTVARSN